MLILGLDSTAVSASAAVAEIEGGELKTYAAFTARNRMTHSENLLPMIDHVLTVYGAAFSDVNLMSVNVGPGSFTGVRIGVSTVKGLAFPADLPCAAVSTLASLAMNLHGMRETVCALMDARRGQFYYALFENGVRLTPDGVADAETVAEAIRSRSSGRVLLCGDGAIPFASHFPGEQGWIPAPESCRDQNALSVALCGEKQFRDGETVSSGILRPVYLRLPQAERERLEKGKQTEQI